jgi:uncharacterized membrane protein
METSTSRPNPVLSPESDASRRADRRRASAGRALVWSVALALAVYFVTKNFARYVTLDEAKYGAYWWARITWLLPHLTGGFLAIALGPIQFWSAFRRRYARLHRWVGRAYVASIALAATMAFVLISRTEFGWVYGSGLFGLACAWIGTTGLAVAAIRRGNVAQHREWMVRSYVVTFGFVTFRAVSDGLGAVGIGTVTERIAVASWSCWAVPLLVTELCLQGRKILATPRRPLPALPE